MTSVVEAEVGLSRVARRAGWGFADQVLSSATNFALGIVVAATVSATQFGAFSVVYAVYGVALGISAGLASTPLVVRYSAAEGEELRAAERASAGAALSVGLAAAVLLGLASVAAPGPVAHPMAAMALVLPGLLVQDAWRFAFTAGRRPVFATVNDAVWAALQVVGMVAVLSAHAASASTMILMWGGSATLAALLGCRQAGALPSLRGSPAWFRQQRDLGPRYALESVAHRSGAWLALGVVGLVAGLPAVAALRGGLLLVTGPLNLLFVGAAFAAVPEGVRLLRVQPRRFPGAVQLFAVVVVAVAAAWCGLLLLLAGRVGHVLLGASWSPARPLLLLLCLFAVLQAACVGPTQGLWVLGAARRSVAVQVGAVALTVTAMATGAFAAGGHGAAAGLVAATAAAGGLWWWQFSTAVGERARETVAGV